MKSTVEWGTLYLCPTPIGNLDDITLRTIQVLNQVDLIACEDTRVSIKLLHHLSIKKPMISFHAHNIESALGKIILHLKEGKQVALITDAGMPGIQDPGMEIIQELVKEHINLEVLPGASAVLPAIVYSGFSTHGFIFLGFLPKTGQMRKKSLQQSLSLTQAVVLYESPNRILSTLQEIQSYIGEERRVVLCRELTKIHQEILRGSVTEIMEKLTRNQVIRGEIVVVIEGNTKNEEIMSFSAIKCIKYFWKKGYSAKDIVELTSHIFDLKKNAVKRELEKIMETDGWVQGT